MYIYRTPEGCDSQLLVYFKTILCKPIKSSKIAKVHLSSDCNSYIYQQFGYMFVSSISNKKTQVINPSIHSRRPVERHESHIHDQVIKVVLHFILLLAK